MSKKVLERKCNVLFIIIIGGRSFLQTSDLLLCLKTLLLLLLDITLAELRSINPFPRSSELSQFDEFSDTAAKYEFRSTNEALSEPTPASHPHLHFLPPETLYRRALTTFV